MRANGEELKIKNQEPACHHNGYAMAGRLKIEEKKAFKPKKEGVALLLLHPF